MDPTSTFMDQISPITVKYQRWTPKRYAAQMYLSDMDRLRTPKPLWTQHVRFSHIRLAERCADAVRAEVVVGSRTETTKRTDTHPVRLPYAATVEVERVEYDTPAWMGVLLLCLLVWLWWPKGRVVKDTHTVNGFTDGYVGVVVEEVHNTYLDPSFEERYGPFKTTYVDVASYDEPLLHWILE